MNRHAPALRTLVLALAVAALAAGCGKQDATTATPAATTATASAPTATSGTDAAAETPYTQAARGNGFSVGPMMSAHVVYVFFDPTCPHCAHLWEQSQPLASKLRVVWLPVGFLRPTSANQAATILASTDPAAAMQRNEASVMERGPGIPIDPNVPADVVAKVKANTELLQKLGAESVPFIVWKNGKSAQVGTHAGAVSTQELAAFVGL